MGPSVKQVNNAATPVANDFAKYLEGLLTQQTGAQTVGPAQANAGSATQNYLSQFNNPAAMKLGAQIDSKNVIPTFNSDFGSGVGALNVDAGNRIRSFLDTQNPGAGGLDPGTAAMIAALTADAGVRTNRAAADQREVFGAAGNRYSKALGSSEALLRSESERGLNLSIADILMNRQVQTEGNILAGIQELSSQGQAALIPYLALLQLGLPQAENVVSPGIGSQILSGVASAGASYLGRGRN